MKNSTGKNIFERLIVSLEILIERNFLTFKETKESSKSVNPKNVLPYFL